MVVKFHADGHSSCSPMPAHRAAPRMNRPRQWDDGLGKLATEERLRGMIAAVRDNGDRDRLTSLLSRSSFLSAGQHSAVRQQSNPYDEISRLRSSNASLQQKSAVARARLADTRVDARRLEHAAEALVAESTQPAAPAPLRLARSLARTHTRAAKHLHPCLERGHAPAMSAHPSMITDS